MNPIGLKFMIEKREGHGEDSAPLSIVKENFCAVGVFDGMGGAGAAICKSEFGDEHTKAYVASRIILEAINNYMENAKDVRDINSDGIKSTAHGRLEQEKSNYPTKASGLRSKLVRDYPTTLAITTALQNEDGTHTVNSYWAGDSRNYLWTAEGFYQISKDDLDTELDPLENLRNDGALSNCICADRKFEINNKTITLEGKFVILSATDGCFNYFATPMHFNDVLVTGLKLSDNIEEWECFCKSEITDVTGDDVSLSLIAVGFEDFKDLKESLSNSSVVKIEEIKKVQNELKSLSKQIEDNKAALEHLIQEGWDEYKTSYMKFLNQEESEAGERNISSKGNANNDEEVRPTDSLKEGIISEKVNNETSVLPTDSAPEDSKLTETTKSDTSSIEEPAKVEENSSEDIHISSTEDKNISEEAKLDSDVIPISDATICPDDPKDEMISAKDEELRKNGFPPIRLNAHQSTTSLRSKTKFSKEEEDKKVCLSKSESKIIFFDFFRISSFDEALSYFQNKIQHSGFSEDVIDVANQFLEKLKSR